MPIFWDGEDYDIIAGPKQEDLFLSVPVAYQQKKGFVPIRKTGKLPRETVSKEYDLEYGSACIEVHKDSIKRSKSCYH